MTAYLTGDEIAQRRTELGQVEEQLKALGRRRSVLRAEILSGFAAPAKGAAPEQLPLVETAPTATTATPAPEAPSHAPEAAKPAAAARSAIQLREAVLAALRAAKGRRSGRVLATLLGESEEDVHECLMELIERGEARSARRGGYEATDKPQARGRDTKPGKGQKKPAAAPPAEPIVLGDMTMTEVRQVLLDEIGTWTRWHSGAAADHALWEKLRESGHDDEDGFDLGRNVDKVGQEALTALAKEGRIQYSEAPGNWNNSYASLGVPRTAEGGPDEPRPPRAKKASKKAPAKSAKPAAKKAAKKAPSKGKKAGEAPARSLSDHIESELRAWGTWVDVEQLQARVREEMPLTSGPSSREWDDTIRLMQGQRRIESCEDNGRTLVRMRSYTVPAWDGADWRKERKDTVALIAKRHKANKSIEGGTDVSPRLSLLRYLEGAGALVSEGGGSFAVSCEIDDARVSEGVWRMSLDHLLDAVEENAAVNGGVWPTALGLAGLLEAPVGLVKDMVAELLDLGRLREVPQTVGAPRLQVLPSPKGKKRSSAATRTKPLFEDVEPAPAGEEAAE